MKWMPLPILLGLLLTLAATAAEDSPAAPAGPVINEFLAGNGSRTPLGAGDVLDADGDSSDWIELYNPTPEAVNLGGWYLTDDPDELTQWRFPAGTRIAANGYLLVFASGKNRTSGQLHTNFRLGAEGGYLALVMPDGRTIAHEYGRDVPAATDRHLLRPRPARGPVCDRPRPRLLPRAGSRRCRSRTGLP